MVAVPGRIDDDEPALRLHRVSRHFGHGDATVEAVRGVDLDVWAGDHWSFRVREVDAAQYHRSLGLAIERFVPDRRSINRDLSDRQLTRLRARTIGFVFQSFHLVPFRSALENVGIGLLYADVPRRRRRIIAREALDRVGLSHRENADPATLSGGERQRVGIARALASAPTLLLCDEPTGNLDSTNADQIVSLLIDLNHQGVTLLVVTHDEGVAATARRRGTMRDGRLTEERLSSQVAFR